MPERTAHAEWMARIAGKRDAEAFAQLFDHFAPRLKGYLLGLGADPVTAEEIVQDTMTAVWRKADLFDAQKSSLATWIFRIARNRRIDLLRRRRGQTIDLEGFDVADEDLPDPDTGLDARQRETRVHAALAGLPDEQRSLVELSFFAELSHSDIAERTGLPLGTVKSRIRLAFARMRKALEADDKVDTPQ
ncbi:MAG: sigma-70 family RNA polymerase sigma factor [Hyphomicrobiaceae bacterium]|nr:sigma-70 family RNA polymerase sigma factor [Hyphomicrobiaceae bacterium]